MGRNAHTRTPRGRRIALSCGTAAGAALIAASISMGNAPAARADVIEADPVSDLIGAFDPHALSAAGVPEADAISYLIEAFDPDSFSSSGAPTDALGLLGYGLDTYLLGPSGLDAVLAPHVEELVGTVTVGSGPPAEPPAVSDLIAALDPNAFTSGNLAAPTDALGLLAYSLDTYLLGSTGLDALLYPYVEDYLDSMGSGSASVLDADPVSDLIGALDPNAFNALDVADGGLGDLASSLDLMAPTGLADALGPVIDGLLGSGLSLF
jgi:hypothetical protein